MSETAENPLAVQFGESKKAILDALADGQTYESACAQGGISHTTLYRWCAASPDYAKAVKLARAEGKRKRAAELESVLFASAAKAADDPRYTTALIFALKNLDSEHYRDVHDLRHEGGVQLQTTVCVVQVESPERQALEAQAIEEDNADGGALEDNQ